MVRRCCVCRKTDANTQISFHRFPTDFLRKKVWYEILGFQPNKILPKRAEICSEHFLDRDFYLKKNGIKVLLHYADPIPFHERYSDSDSESIEQLAPRGEDKENLDPQDDSSSLSNVANDEELENLPGPSKVSQLVTQHEKHSDLPNTSSSTLTASETERIVLNEMEHQTEAAQMVVTGPQSEFRGILALVDPSTRKRKRRKAYVGDLDSDDFAMPEEARQNYHLLKKEVLSLRRKVKILQGNVSRLKSKVTNLNELIQVLQEKHQLTESSQNAIRASLSGTAGEIFERLLLGPSKQKYNETLRCFALTLSFYSPSAYEFVRSAFNKTLPHLGTISRWYKSVNGLPGFTEEALVVLKMKQEEASKRGQKILCNLVLDEMSIRKQTEWTGTRFTGYVDIGSGFNSDQLPEAREALVFLFVCLNENWKIPVGYFLIDGISGSEKANLVIKCLEFFHETGATVTSVTCDGAPSNFKMVEQLGANFVDVTNLKTDFKHPVTNETMYIFFDPCHMIKLIRNCFASQKKLKDGDGRDIEWKYVEKLVEKQYDEGLHLANKVKLRHLDWEREKMKVRLAVQVLSRSVSDAILFLSENERYPEFHNAKATSHFMRIFNDLFDIFNSRNILSKYRYKRPLSKNNASHMFQYLQEMEKYILDLCLNECSILKSPRKTGFLGFLICIKSLRSMFKYYVEEKASLKYISTYRISQDHIELLFSAIRMKGGFNNNPTARQFEAAYKRLLVHTEIKGATTGNVTNLEGLSILTCGTGITINENGENLQASREYLTIFENFQSEMEEYISSDAWNLTPYIEDVVPYIAGYVVKSVTKCITCSYCLEMLNGCIPTRFETTKRWGKLFVASNFVITTCKSAEKVFRFYLKKDGFSQKCLLDHTMNILINTTMGALPSDTLSVFSDHLYEDDPSNNHIFDVLKLVLKNYFKIRIHHEMNKKTDITRKGRIRSLSTKLILFRNE